MCWWGLAWNNEDAAMIVSNELQAFNLFIFKAQKANPKQNCTEKQGYCYSWQTMAQSNSSEQFDSVVSDVMFVEKHCGA